MSSVLEKLAAGRPRSVEVAAEVLAQPELIDQLFDSIADHNKTLRNRSIDALEMVSRTRADLLAPYKREILARVALVDHWIVRSHVCQILPRLTNLTPHERRRWLGNVERYLNDPSSVVKAVAIECLVRLSLARGFETECAHVSKLVDRCATCGETPALRARARAMQRLLVKLARSREA